MVSSWMASALRIGWYGGDEGVGEEGVETWPKMVSSMLASVTPSNTDVMLTLLYLFQWGEGCEFSPAVKAFLVQQAAEYELLTTRMVGL